MLSVNTAAPAAAAAVVVGGGGGCWCAILIYLSASWIFMVDGRDFCVAVDESREVERLEFLSSLDYGHQDSPTA